MVAVPALPGRPQDPESNALLPIGRDAARARNAVIPFATTRPPPARPFDFRGSGEDRAHATECLALAAIAEAGGGDPDQRAVIQVVLNRVRHPAFAKTICGVVFEGSHLPTGCQFSFTCDGALSRRYSDAAWRAARRRASEALGGAVFAPVGAATHYHTDWVHPVWSAQLEKIAQVDTHLFFRWPGYWGSRAVARIPYRGGEAAMSQLRAPAPRAGADAADPEGPREAAATVEEFDLAGAGRVIVKHPDGGAFLVQLSPGLSPASALKLGRGLCGGTGYCRVSAWFDRGDIPKGYPIPPPARASLGFSYVLDASGAEYPLYDCKRFRAVVREQCLPPPLPG